MTTQIQYPETVACYFRVVSTTTGELYIPATSMKISIYDPSGALVVNSVDMTNISPVTIGVTTYNYEYFYQTSTSSVMGTYRVRYIADNAGYITIQDDSFVLSKTGV